MRLELIKIIHYVVFFVTIVSGVFLWTQVSDIISERNAIRTETKNSPITVKGVMYFVTAKQKFYYNLSERIFFVGCVVNALLIAWRRKYGAIEAK